MSLLLYIQIKPVSEVRFGNPFAKLLDQKVECFDVDNHSDEWIIQHQLNSLKAAKSIILVLDVLPGPSPGKTSRLIEHLFRNKNKLLKTLIFGHHELLDQMLKLSKVDVVRYKKWSELEEKVAALMP